MRETKLFQFGEDGERDIAQELILRGMTVIPVYQFNNHDKAPLAYRAGGRHLAIPDLLVHNNGTTRYVECKAKTRWIKYLDTVETGFNQSSFNHYSTLEKESGIPVIVVFKHVSQEPTGYFWGRLSELSPVRRDWDGRHVRTGAKVSPPLTLFPITALSRLSWSLPVEVARQEQRVLFEGPRP